MRYERLRSLLGIMLETMVRRTSFEDRQSPIIHEHLRNVIADRDGTACLMGSQGELLFAGELNSRRSPPLHTLLAVSDEFSERERVELLGAFTAA